MSLFEIKYLEGLCLDVEYANFCLLGLFPAKVVTCVDVLGLEVGNCTGNFVIVYFTFAIIDSLDNRLSWIILFFVLGPLLDFMEKKLASLVHHQMLQGTWSLALLRDALTVDKLTLLVYKEHPCFEIFHTILQNHASAAISQATDRNFLPLGRVKYLLQRLRDSQDLAFDRHQSPVVFFSAGHLQQYMLSWKLIKWAHAAPERLSSEL